MEEDSSVTCNSEKANAANACKTPVSLLQELYVRKGITPKYDLVQIEGAVHEPTFKYRVTVGDMVATGCGQSKKKAKHCAARTILDKLWSSGALSRSDAAAAELLSVSASTTASSASSLSHAVPSYDDGIPGNPVGELQEMCMNRRMQPPIYEVSREEGQPHERSFVLVCLVGSKFREIGSGKSKKMAKRQAAHKMLTKLKEIPAECDSSASGCSVVGGNGANERILDDDELAQGIAQRNSTLKDIYKISSAVFKFYNNNLRVVIGSKLSALQKEFNNDDYVETAIKKLDEIAEEQQFSVTYMEIEERAKSGDYHCLVQLSTNPVAVCYGVGDSERNAKRNSALNALDDTMGISEPQGCLLRSSDVDVENEELWLIRAPAELSKNDLEGLNIEFTGNSTIEANGKLLDVHATKKKTTLNLVLSDDCGRFKTAVCGIRGEVNIFNGVDVPDLPEIVVPERSVVLQPSAIKTRHPLFGCDSPPVSRKRENSEVSERTSKKHKKKKSKNH